LEVIQQKKTKRRLGSNTTEKTQKEIHKEISEKHMKNTNEQTKKHNIY